jgi:hypothetical protein
MSDRADTHAELWFDHWLMPDNALSPMVRDFTAVIETNMRRDGGRAIQGHRRKAFEATTGAVFGNLCRAVWEADTGLVAVPLRNADKAGLDRYGCPLVPVKTLGRVLDTAEASGFLTVRKGRRGFTTTIAPTEAFKDDLARLTAGPVAMGRREGEELIILSQRRREAIAEGDGIDSEPRDWRERVPYTDTAATIAMREEVATINDHLSRADLAFTDDGLTPAVHTGDRRLRRHFNLIPEGMASLPPPPSSLSPNSEASPSFAHGGRLFGAFWSNLEGDRRRASLLIDGEPIAEVDFNALFTRLAYARIGKALGGNDPYASLGDDLLAYRKGVKKAVNALLFSDGILKRWPVTIIEGLPPKMTVRDLVERVHQHLPDLTSFLGTGIGYAFMRTESDISVKAFLKLATSRGIVGLPLHDAMLVARSKAPEVKAVMEETGLEVAGVPLPVAFK